MHGTVKLVHGTVAHQFMIIMVHQTVNRVVHETVNLEMVHEMVSFGAWDGQLFLRIYLFLHDDISLHVNVDGLPYCKELFIFGNLLGNTNIVDDDQYFDFSSLFSFF